MRISKSWFSLFLILLSACTVVTPRVPAVPTLAPSSSPLAASTLPSQPAPVMATAAINLDAPTQARIALAKRIVFVVPFSHWDTDWHDTFMAYADQADRNILAAIQGAQRDSRFRYTFEQVLFVQHLWTSHPEARADLVAAVQRRQLTFAWAGITQPETSLASPAVQVRNLQLGQDWITQTFGAAYVPHTAWQSDAFGNSAALPIFLAQSAIKYLFIGRWQHRCDPDYDPCTPLPHLFHWSSPVAPAQQVLVAYQAYSQAFGSLERITDEGTQLANLRTAVSGLAARTDSKYLLLPFGDDFWNPLPNLSALVDRWNAADPATLLVIADPETAFDYLATQTLPTITADLNPIWQGFYATRPAAKIADKESAAYLTAADKFGVLWQTLGGGPTAQSTAWYTATVNAHYDNLGAVSFDRVWAASQQPRFEQTVATAGTDLARTLAQIASHVPSPLVVFNPLSWPRSGVVELHGRLPDSQFLPALRQHLGPEHIAIWVDNVPPVGYLAPAAGGQHALAHPATITEAGPEMTLSNGLVAVTLDRTHGGAFSRLALLGGPPLLQAFGDDVTAISDHGDVYGAAFGRERGRESTGPATLTILAAGPLIARVQVVFDLGGQPITKTVSLEANRPQIDVSVLLANLPETTMIVQIPTTRATTTRTDDLGFAHWEHPIDARPIISGTVTYRREVFYPIMTWSDVSTDGAGLALLTHGLQGLGGTQTLSLMLGRQVSDRDDEGVTDAAYHLLHYAYLPHPGTATTTRPWQAAAAFNQPLIPAWQAAGQMQVQLPWQPTSGQFPLPFDRMTAPAPRTASLIAATTGLVADLFSHTSGLTAVVLNNEPTQSTTLTTRTGEAIVPGAALTLTTVNLK